MFSSFGTPILEVGISLILLYVLLSLVTSQMNEVIALVFSMRARHLWDGIRHMLGEESFSTELTATLFEHPLIKSLSYRGGKRRKTTYIPTGTFSTVLLESIKNVDATSIIRPVEQLLPILRDRLEAQIANLPLDFREDIRLALIRVTQEDYPLAYVRNVIDKLPEDIDSEIKDTLLEIVFHQDPLADIRAAVERLPSDMRARGALLTLIGEAKGSIEAFHTSVGQWFDDTMDRVTEWYRNWAKSLITIMAAVLVVALNADTIMITRLLWNDPAARAALVAVADSITTEADSLDSEEVRQVILATLDTGLENIDLPLGWQDNPEDADNLQGFPRTVEGVLLKLVGFILTIAAISFGAPFWFDLLKMVLNLRRSSSDSESEEPVGG
jgi:hypothetical protein